MLARVTASGNQKRFWGFYDRLYKRKIVGHVTLPQGIVQNPICRCFVSEQHPSLVMARKKTEETFRCMGCGRALEHPPVLAAGGLPSEEYPAHEERSEEEDD